MTNNELKSDKRTCQIEFTQIRRRKVKTLFILDSIGRLVLISKTNDKSLLNQTPATHPFPELSDQLLESNPFKKNSFLNQTNRKTSTFNQPNRKIASPFFNTPPYLQMQPKFSLRKPHMDALPWFWSKPQAAGFSIALRTQGHTQRHS